MDYNQVMEYIYSIRKFGSKLGLENIKDLLILMGDPQKDLKFIHIAGTNGKGSTTAFLSYVLIENGLRVGTYTSPYIIRFNERIKLNFENIDDQDLVDITIFVKEKIDMLISEGKRHPTIFEIVTCIAFEYYKRKKCDIVVLETGLGGRLDATNIIDDPLYSVITKIGYDHIEYLGDTIERIAFEKAGIIKKGTKVFTIDQSREVISVLENVCKKQICGLNVVKPIYKLISRTIDSQIYMYKDTKLEISLLGEHQIRNSILAFEVLVDMGISHDVIAMGFKKTRWIGRLEVLRKDPIVLIDGAHNHDAVIELKKMIKTYFPNKKIIFIIGVFKNKNYPQMIEEISECAKMFFAVQIDDERALDVDILVKEIKKYFKNVQKSGKIITAVTSSLNAATKDDVIIVFGSLSYIGEVKELIKKMED